MRNVLLKIVLTFASLFWVNGIQQDCQVFLEIQQEHLHCLAQLNKFNGTNLSTGCHGTWANLSCWLPAKVGETVTVHCPKLFRHFSDKIGNVSKNCTAMGWSESFPAYDIACGYEEIIVDTFFVLAKAIYTFGHSVSLVALTTGSAILILFRKLHCTRNYIHLNLFFSFILRAISVFLKDGALFSDDSSLECEEASMVGCKAILVFFQYSIIANFYWLLVEGLYLQTLLLFFFSENKYFAVYILIGWGMPTLFTVVWTLTRVYLEDTDCWDTNRHIIPWWTISGPILLSIILNFLLFISIIRILVQKLRSPDIGRNDQLQYKRLTKSTLLLIPLFGVHYMVFAFFPHNVSTNYKIAFELCLGSFQPLTFLISETQVQTELKRKWRGVISNRKLNADDNMHRTSITGNGSSIRNACAQSIQQSETSVV
uniref:Vasoactive intestinal peptide receptor 2 n=1 Tax=Callorhinchus milii TaxID=7868 RepID=A0A4W3GL26_CALMI